MASFLHDCLPDIIRHGTTVFAKIEDIIRLGTNVLAKREDIIRHGNTVLAKGGGGGGALSDMEPLCLLKERTLLGL